MDNTEIFQCPNCDGKNIKSADTTTSFPYLINESTIEIPVILCVHTCDDCEEEFLDSSSEEKKQKAIQEYLATANWKWHRLSDDEIKDFVKELLGGNIYTFERCLDCNIDPGLVFMPLGFGAMAKFPEKELENIGTICENIKEAAPRFVNGQPMFFSMKIIHKEDWARIVEKHNNALKTIDKK